MDPEPAPPLATLPTPPPTDAARAPQQALRPSRLPLYLALAYLVLIVYASLYPFANWRDLGAPPLLFLDAAWPRYWTGFDVAMNIIAYVPLGFLLTLALRRLPGGRWTAAIVALLLGSLLSFVMEWLQNWLPARVPSNLDLAFNAGGTAIGAALAVWRGKRIFRRIVEIQRTSLAPIAHIELGLVLLSAWLLTQLSPETLLFGTGDLRHLLELAPAVPYAPHSFFILEAVVIACNTIVIGLLARALLAEQPSAHLALLTLFGLALAIRALATAVLVAPQSAFAWLTPGAELGLLIGGVLLALLLLLPAPVRLALAGVALMAGTALVNLTPSNPYSEAARAAWHQGHFLYFNGFTRWVASLWPFFALPYLTLIGREI